MAEPGAAEITERPTTGRVFEGGRRIRLGDVDATGRCRLDAAVRYLQDVARDDSANSNLIDPMTWVVRRVMLEVHVSPMFQEWVDVRDMVGLNDAENWKIRGSIPHPANCS